MAAADTFPPDDLITDLEHRLGLPRGFFQHLVDEDDWSFIIKLHALFDAACTHMLLFHFQEPDLEDLISRIELSNKATGKVAFLGKLGLLGKHGRRYIASLSELRNSLVHDVRQSAFSLATWVSALSDSEIKQFAIAFSPHETFFRELKGPLAIKPDDRMWAHTRLEVVLARARERPKHHIWIGAYHVLTSMLDMKGFSEYRLSQKFDAFFRSDYEDMLPEPE